MIVGLGNPGSKYLMTRHNVGFMAVDYLAKSLELTEGQLEEKSLTCHFKWGNTPCMLVKPQAYMNLSGESVGTLARYYKVSLENILVIHDDLDQPFGQMKIKTNSGAGGHNGVTSIIEHLENNNSFPRIKIGIGRPTIPGMEVANYVLQKFSPEEQQALPDLLNQVCDAVEGIVFDGLLKAMNQFNGGKS